MASEANIVLSGSSARKMTPKAVSAVITASPTRGRIGARLFRLPATLGFTYML